MKYVQPGLRKGGISNNRAISERKLPVEVGRSVRCCLWPLG